LNLLEIGPIPRAAEGFPVIKLHEIAELPAVLPLKLKMALSPEQIELGTTKDAVGCSIILKVFTFVIAHPPSDTVSFTVSIPDVVG
jgi:hypothetical protein